MIVTGGASGIGRFEQSFGPIDGLAHVAGWDRPVPFLETEPAFRDEIIRINLYGTLAVHHVLARAMAERGSGRVVNVASDAGSRKIAPASSPSCSAAMRAISPARRSASPAASR